MSTVRVGDYREIPERGVSLDREGRGTGDQDHRSAKRYGRGDPDRRWWDEDDSLTDTPEPLWFKATCQDDAAEMACHHRAILDPKGGDVMAGNTRGWVFLGSLLIFAAVLTQLKTVFG